MLLFVYGTLKRGGSAFDLMDKARFVGEATTSPSYVLFDVGGFPGMTKHEGAEGGVYGEVFAIDDFEGTDYYEGVASGLFRREEIELSDGRKVQAYLYNRSLRKCEQIQGGIWNEHEE